MGNLPNFTDNILKSWSEAGKIVYQVFDYKLPNAFPFGNARAHTAIGGSRLTFNWNTAGVGLVSTMQGVEILSIRNTGSLPVSYSPRDQKIMKPLRKTYGSRGSGVQIFSIFARPMAQPSRTIRRLISSLLSFRCAS
jgi:hypothetical protein